MDAIKLLKVQHKEVEALYASFRAADKGSGERRALFQRIADALAVHAALEEDIFYPACANAGCRVDFDKMVEEHLWVKRMISDALDAEFGNRFDCTVEVLCENALHHAKIEEKTLLKEAKHRLSRTALNRLGAQMKALADASRESDARHTVRDELIGAPV